MAAAISSNAGGCGEGYQCRNDACEEIIEPCVAKSFEEACAPVDGAQRCGPVSDGCDGSIDCGTCTSGSCGGGGTPGVCGSPSCEPRTCDFYDANCGSVPDGCDSTIDCGTCSSPEWCGGGGVPNQCGQPECQPQSCQDQGIECGMAGDGCGATIACGDCPDGQSCGGGGEPDVCGAPACDPQTCADFPDVECGPVSDGCGGITESCGTCSGNSICGVYEPSRCGNPFDPNCQSGELCEHQYFCEDGGATTVTGKVYAPNGTIPLYNAIVYVPRDPSAPLPTIPEGPGCDRCEDEDLGDPLVAALTASDGSFELRHVPANVDFPLVVKIGKWRRAVTIPARGPCSTTELTPSQTRLPRNQSEGHIPKIAISTGSEDALECVLYKAGVEASQFTRNNNASGRIHLYRSNGAWPDSGLADCGSFCEPHMEINCNWGNYNTCRNNLSYNLWGDSDHSRPSRLHEYDIVMFGCEYDGGTWHRDEFNDHGGADGDGGGKERLRNYLNAGGRFFASHSNLMWLRGDPELGTVATFPTDGPLYLGNLSDPTDAFTDQSFPKGVSFVEWLNAPGVDAAYLGDRIQIHQPSRDLGQTTANSQRWTYTTQNHHGESAVQNFTFNTPVGASDADMCGRGVATAFHVTHSESSGTYGWARDYAFPDHCGGPMTAQEKVLLFMMFDLAACVSGDGVEPPPPPTCEARTCADEGKNCGSIPDGCGGTLDCGTCPSGESCGGGGTPNVCGVGCTPRTCAEAGANCGFIADGCGGTIYCGDCPSPQTCGGGGQGNICGVPPCQPWTCEQVGANCGEMGNGCGGTIDCGDCPDGQTCGAGGAANQCGVGSCTPQTCGDQGATCGYVGDGCGDSIYCGSCDSPLTCGGGGVPNECGGNPCVPRTCGDAGAECGWIGDGCGDGIHCGDCPSGEACGGGGVANQCGGGCVPLTCAEQNANCGWVGDGCGGSIHCGSCPSGESCGGGGVANQCGSGTCSPTSCVDFGATCGTIGDGCGGSLFCGNCTAPESCGGGGVPYQCGTTCTPLTCEAHGADCGSVGDGCGGLLDCGVCTPPLVCGANEANKCGDII